MDWCTAQDRHDDLPLQRSEAREAEGLAQRLIQQRAIALLDIL